MDGASARVLREIELALGRAVSRYGKGGQVRIDGDDVVLEGAGDVVATELGDLPFSWPELSPNERTRRITALARTLVVSRAIEHQREPSRGALGWLVAIGVIAVAVAAAIAWWHRSNDGTRSVSVGPLPALADDEAREIEKRSCESTSARAEQGEHLGPDDTRGWVVELALLRRGETDVVFDPGLLAFIERAPGRRNGRFVWAGAPEISRLVGPSTEVEVIEADLPDAGLRGARLVFKGRYVEPYFAAERRAAFEKSAQAISERLAASVSGLYARCAHLPKRYAGSWFRGRAPGDAALGLVWFMAPDGVEQKGAFATLEREASRVEKKKLEALVTPAGATIGSDARGATLVRFPFVDPARAKKSSAEIARELGLSR